MLEPERGGLFVDATVGAGGHAEVLLERGGEIRLLGIDRDPEALVLAGERLARFPGRVELLAGDFAELDALFPDDLRPPAFSRTSASRRCSSIGASAAFLSGGTAPSTCAWDKRPHRRRHRRDGFGQ